MTNKHKMIKYFTRTFAILMLFLIISSTVYLLISAIFQMISTV